MRFVTRELGKVFKQLAAAVEGTKIHISINVERWNHHHLETSLPATLTITLVETGARPVKQFEFKDYSSLEAMVSEALHAIENWGDS